jgi:hypothetical protein
MKVIFVALLLLLAGCAPTQMTRDAWSDQVAGQQARVDAKPVCCTNLAELPYVALKDDGGEFQIDSTLPVRDFGPFRAPVLGLAFAADDYERVLEIFSFSDRKRSMMRLDRLLFIRPSVEFLDADFQRISRVDDPELCWGSKSGSSGAWVRLGVPVGARYMAINPSIARPSQPIDTRVLGGAHAVMAPVPALIADSVSEARQSYHADIFMGLEGLLGVEILQSPRTVPGRCRDTAG